jgi:hypothetical protein
VLSTEEFLVALTIVMTFAAILAVAIIKEKR